MTDRFAKRYRAVAGLIIALGRRFFQRTSRSAGWAIRCLLEMRRVLLRQSFIDRTGHQLRHFVAKVFDLGERRIERRPIGTEAASCHGSNAFIELLLGLGGQNNHLESVLAHASFLPKQANCPS